MRFFFFSTRDGQQRFPLVGWGGRWFKEKGHPFWGKGARVKGAWIRGRLGGGETPPPPNNKKTKKRCVYNEG